MSDGCGTSTCGGSQSDYVNQWNICVLQSFIDRSHYQYRVLILKRPHNLFRYKPNQTNTSNYSFAKADQNVVPLVQKMCEATWPICNGINNPFYKINQINLVVTTEWYWQSKTDNVVVADLQYGTI